LEKDVQQKPPNPQNVVATPYHDEELRPEVVSPLLTSEASESQHHYVAFFSKKLKPPKIT
jgi:hypothetical protein